MSLPAQMPEKSDVNYYLLEHGENALRSLLLNTINESESNNKSQLKVVRLKNFLEMDLPPRELILSPWLPTSGLCMIHAFRGVGKTHLSLGIAYALSSGGSFLNWKSDKPRGVLLIDGEMPAGSLQERIARIVIMNGQSFIDGKLNIITPDLQDRYLMPDLSTSEGQQMLEQHITDDIDLIILDNLSCLAPSIKENDASDWAPFQTWVLHQRAKGKSVLIIHHSGKSGGQRGTSKKEDVLDTVIALERPKDYEPNQGARFVVKFEKARGFFGEDAKPFEAHLIDDNGKPCWKIQSLEETTFEKVVSMTNDGMSPKEIEIEMEINKSIVYRHLNEAKRQGLINKGVSKNQNQGTYLSD